MLETNNIICFTWFLLLFSHSRISNCVQLFATPWTAAHQAPLSFTIFWSFLKFMFIESMILSNHIIVYCLLLLLPSIFPSIRVFTNELALHIRCLKYWNCSLSISPSNEYSQSISFRIDRFDLLAVQVTLVVSFY